MVDPVVLELDGKITQWKSAIASANNVMQSASQFGKIEQQTSSYVVIAIV